MAGNAKLCMFALYLIFLPYGAISEGSFFIKLPFDNRDIQISGSRYNMNNLKYCLQLCLKSTTCVSLSYENSLKMCSLYPQVLNSSYFGAAQDDIIYYGKQDNGNWTPWSNYTACGATCSVALKFRFRTCTNPEPVYGGGCEGRSYQGKSCFYAHCPDFVCRINPNYHYDASTVTCIRIHYEDQMFDDAKSICEEDGAHLLKMDSVERKDFVVASFTAASSAPSFLLGAKDYTDNDTFTWTDGSPVTWIGGAPDASDENCVQWLIASSKMDDTYCQTPMPFICQMPVWPED